MTLLAPTRATALNIGSGARPQGALTFLFADAAAWPVDVQADLRHLPFRSEHFTHINCSHLIEHVPLAEAVPALTELRRVLHPDGVLYLAAPDMERARAAGSHEWMQFTIKGGNRKGWEHRWTATTRKVRRLLTEAGFTPTWAPTIPTGFPPNTHSWPVDFEARFLCRRDDFPWPQEFPSGMAVTR